MQLEIRDEGIGIPVMINNTFMMHFSVQETSGQPGD